MNVMKWDSVLSTIDLAKTIYCHPEWTDSRTKLTGAYNSGLYNPKSEDDYERVRSILNNEGIVWSEFSRIS
jgi:hypothetical protein